MTEDANRWARVQSLFEQALARPEDERDAWLQQHADAELREDVRRLLRHDEGAGPVDPVEAVVAEAAGGWLQQRADRLVGTRLGPWRLERHLADGGMGAVYLATRADGQFEQRAAVKLLNPALTSSLFAERLALERQILARLQHPHIAALLDGGTTDDGAPYLVMAFVDGHPIDRHCAQQALDTPARLRLVQQVCEAVEHAHRNLVVHRDLKPANILVDADGQVKLLDFGVARLVEDDDGVATRADQRLLTPRYASPEQLRGQPVTTATDVYALGVLLYELLTGRSPYPADPSTPVDPAGLAQEILQTEPRRPSRAAPAPDGPPPGAIARELDLVVLKAMHKDPARRYPSARALADDLERHLQHRPVSAHADSLGYRMAKFVRRHRVAVPVSALAVIAAVSAGAAFTLRLEDERRKAEAQAARAEHVADFMTGVFDVADPRVNQGHAVTARELLDNAARQVDVALADDPGTLAPLRTTIGRAFLGLGLYDQALPHFERAAALAASSLGEDSVEALRARSARGDALQKMGRYDDAVLELQAVVEALQEVPPSTLMVATTSLLGVALWRQGRDTEGAQRQLRRAVELATQLGAEGDVHRARAIANLADHLTFIGRYDEALRWAEQGLALNRRLHGEEHPDTVEGLRSLGLIQLRRHAVPEAIATLERALESSLRIYGDEHLRVAYLRANLALVHSQAGDVVRAEALSRQAMPVFERGLGAEHPRTAFLLENIANYVLEQGRHDEALAMYQRSLDILRQRLGPDHVELGASAGNIAGVYARLQRWHEVLPWARESVRVLQAALGADAPQVAQANAKLAQGQMELGQLEAAADTLARTVAARDQLPPRHALRIELLHLNGDLALRRGRPDEAEPLLRQALDRLREDPAGRGAKLAAAELALARSLAALERYDDAEALLRSAHQGFMTSLGDRHAKTREAERALRKVHQAARAQGRTAPAKRGGG